MRRFLTLLLLSLAVAAHAQQRRHELYAAYGFGAIQYADVINLSLGGGSSRPE